MNNTKRNILVFLLLLPFNYVICQDLIWSVELFMGVPYNFKTNLKIEQDDYPDINLKANYYSEPFVSPFYGSIRLGAMKENMGLEIESIHQKLYLKNTTEEIQRFSISHGYNIITINAKYQNKFVYHAGVGIVLAHAESTIREEKLEETKGLLNMGYYVTGPAFNLSVQKRFELYKKLYFNLEGKLTACYAKIPIKNGTATAPNIAIQFLFGIGYDFKL